jgi:4-amino-4-deoxy-L-arabinose transferase-like glycosyltransferase
MIKRSRLTDFTVFILLSSAICFSYCLLFRPITYEAQGDFPAYLDLAKQIYHLPGATATDLSHRSPLYSLVLGLFILVFGEAHYLVVLMVFQYILICTSSLFIYRIILRLTGARTAAFIAGLAGILNLTTVFFGFMILSETLALALFTVMAWLLTKYYETGTTITITFAGIITGLLVLSRYNMVGIPLVIVVLLVIVAVLNRVTIKPARMMRDLSLFVLGTAVIVSLWAFRNYQTYGRFELIPRSQTGQRWAVPATINPADRVSEEYSEVLAIFLSTRETLLEKEAQRQYRKSSLLEYGFIKRINDYFRPEVSGYLLYRDSENELLTFYHLRKDPDGIRTLNEKLKPFYEEIAYQNRNQINRLRVYSFLYSFKHISPTLATKEPVNLNRLPSFVLKAYKALFIIIMLLTYAGSLVHIAFLLRRKESFRQGMPWIMMYAIIWYFPVINTYANVLSDANRFRFPADMLILGLFVALCFRLFHIVIRPRNAIGQYHEA